MVLEVALIEIAAGAQSEFAAAYHKVKHALADAPGCSSVRMTGGIETPTRIILMVEWDSIDAHEAFRNSPAFGVWRGGVGPLFASPPLVEHFADLD